MFLKRQRGITLMELLVATALMAILAAVAIPSVRGFSQKGKSQAYDGDRDVIQVGVDVWRNSIGRTGGQVWPILEGGETCLGKIDLATGLPSEVGCNPYLDLAAMASEGLLQNAGAIKSADKTKNTTAINEKSGHYGWYVNAQGLVVSYPDFIEGTYP